MSVWDLRKPVISMVFDHSLEPLALLESPSVGRITSLAAVSGSGVVSGDAAGNVRLWHLRDLR